MVVLVICSVLLLAGLVLIVAWGGHELRAPAAQMPAAQMQAAQVPAAQVPTAVKVPAAEAPTAETPATEAPAATQTQTAPRRIRVGRALRRYAWWATVITVAWAASAILLAGAGGRIVMRVLALTSPDAAGRLTEAQALVGDITAGGTLALLVFGALPGAFISAVLYALIHSWLPRGRLGGAVFGVILLLLFATTLDPLRAGNIDFDIVGPGWLAVLLFSVLIILHGMLVAAIAGWYSSRLPLRPTRPRLAYLPLLAAVVYVPVGFLLAAGAVLVLMGASLLPGAGRWLRSRNVTWAGRATLVLLAGVAIPGFVISVVSIVGR